MEKTLSWEANWFSVSLEIPRSAWNLKVHYQVYSPPPVPILSQINPVHSFHPTSWRSILILSSHLRPDLPSVLFPSGFPTKNPVCTTPLPHTCYMFRPSHSSRFDHPKDIWCGVQIITLLMQFSPVPCYLVPLNPKYSPQHPTLNTLGLRSSLNASDHVLHPYKTTVKVIILYILIFAFFGYQNGRQKTRYRMIASILLIQSALNFFLNRILTR